MYIGTSIFLIAVGAALAWAVTAEVAGVDVQTAGVILMVVASSDWSCLSSFRRSGLTGAAGRRA